MSSRITAQRRVRAIAQGLKVQNTNSRVNTEFVYRGALGCPPISYSEITYFVPSCLPQCVVLEPCLTASALDGGVPSYVGLHTFDGGTPFRSGICLYDGGHITICISTSAFNGGTPSSTTSLFLSGGTPQIGGYCHYDGGIP